MKPKRKLKVYADPNSIKVSVGYDDSRLAVAWFWDNIESNALRNAKEYVKWRNGKNNISGNQRRGR